MVLGVLRIAMLMAITPAVGVHLSMGVLSGCLVMLGLLTEGTVPLLLTSLKQLFTSTRLATAIGTMLTMGNCAAGLAQLLWGVMLDYHWEGEVVNGVRLYTATGYTWLLSALAVVSLFTVVGAYLIKETVATQSRISIA